MAKDTDLYRINTSILGVSANSSLYPGNGIELDMREEMRRFLHGAIDETPKGYLVILRRARRNDNGDIIPCNCLDSFTKEPDLDTFCPNCYGEGFLFDEEWITVYSVWVGRLGQKATEDMTAAGSLNLPMKHFYTEYFVNPTKHDKIIEVERDIDGKVVYPYVRKEEFKIVTAEPLKSDRGRVEYWKLATNRLVSKARWDKSR